MVALAPTRTRVRRRDQCEASLELDRPDRLVLPDERDDHGASSAWQPIPRDGTGVASTHRNPSRARASAEDAEMPHGAAMFLEKTGHSAAMRHSLRRTARY